MATPEPGFPTNCLRPAFTEKVIAWLNTGKSINVFGAEGQGIQRLTEDIAMGCPPAVKYIRLSMRSYADSHAGFLQALADALGLEKTNDADIRLLINNYLRTNEQNIWLCLEHFDRLADKQVDDKRVDTQGYDIHFLNYLNSLRNIPRISLLICSRRELRAQELYIGGETVHGSKLEFSEKVPLSTLTFAEIEAFLKSRMPDSSGKNILFDQKPIFYTELITEIDAHPESVGFAALVADQPIDPTWNLDDFHERFRFWKSEYARLHARTIDRKIGGFEKDSRRWLHRAGRMLGIGKMWRSIGVKMKVVIVLISTLALGGWRWGEQVWVFISAYFSK